MVRQGGNSQYSAAEKETRTTDSPVKNCHLLSTNRIVEDRSEAPGEESLRAGVGAFFEASSSVAEEEVT